MKVVEAGHEYMSHEGLTGYEFIEKIGRTCYRSEDKISKGSAEKFVKWLKDRQNWALLEHEPVYFLIEGLYSVGAVYSCFDYEESIRRIRVKDFERKGDKYASAIVAGNLGSFYNFLKHAEPTINLSVVLAKKYTKNRGFNLIRDSHVINGCLLRSMINLLYDKYPLVFEEIWKDCVRDVDLPSVEEELHLVSGEELENDLKDSHPDVLKRVLRRTVKFTSSNGITNELVGLCSCSLAQENTGYYNYVKDKFVGEVTFIKPCFWDEKSPEYMVWYQQVQSAEWAYKKLLSYDAKPNEARSILPNSLTSDIIMTATEEEWQNIVNFRYRGATKALPPQVVELIKGWVKELHELSNGRVSI